MLPVSRRKPLVESANWRLKKVEVFLAYKVQTVQLYLVLVTNKQTEKHLRNQVPTTNQIINHEFQTSNIIFSKQNKKLISKSQPFLKPFFPPPFLPVVSGVSSLWDPPPGFPDNKAQISVACSPRSQMSPLKRKRFAGQGTPTSNKKRRLQTKQTKKWNLLLYSFCFFLVPPFFLIWTQVIANWNLGRICFIFFEAFRFICQITMFAVAIYRDVTGSMAIASDSQVRWVRWWIFRQGPW